MLEGVILMKACGIWEVVGSFVILDTVLRFFLILEAIKFWVFLANRFSFFSDTPLSRVKLKDSSIPLWKFCCVFEIGSSIEPVSL